MPRPIAIDLFSGAGGLSLGFEQAGFDIKVAVEIDPIHASTHKFNFPNCHVLAKSVHEVSATTLLDSCGSAEVDVVVGGAPCQGFSLIGQRALDDPRNSLVKEFIRIVKEVRPKVFVFENVKGLTLGKHRQFLEEVICELGDAGYDVRLPWKVLNARDFSVPQSRERLFLIGSRVGAPPNYPEEHSELVTCFEALEDIPDAEGFDELWTSDCIESRQVSTLSAYAARMRGVDKEVWGFGHPRIWEPTLLTSSMRTNHSDITRRRFSETAEGEVEPISRFFRLPRDGQSNTLRAGTDAARGAFTSPRPIHYEFPRCVTVREMARLHGFPDWFRFHSTKWHGARQIGNAVPPPLARAIAEEVIYELDCKPRRLSRSIKLGNESLLHQDMSEASAFWGVPNPISKRDRKSGVKKRKQREIEIAAGRLHVE